MQYKLIAYGVALFGAGGLLGWAITADHYEQKLKEQEEDYRLILQTKPLGKVTEVSETEDGVEIKGQFYQPDETGFVSFAPLESYLGEGSEHPDDVIPRERAEREAEEAAEVLASAASNLENSQRDDDSEVSEDEDVIPPGETEEETRSKLQGLIDHYTSSPEQAEQFLETAVKEVTGQDHSPFVISQGEYSYDEEGANYDKETLTYYPRERILVDDDEEVIDDVRGVVGWRSLSRFGDDSGDPDIVFVRNRRLNTDYEVVRDDENPPPLHIRYAMPKEEFNTARAAGMLSLRKEDL